MKIDDIVWVVFSQYFTIIKGRVVSKNKIKLDEECPYGYSEIFYDGTTSYEIAFDTLEKAKKYLYIILTEEIVDLENKIQKLKLTRSNLNVINSHTILQNKSKLV